jgi:hypothetical protein
MVIAVDPKSGAVGVGKMVRATLKAEFPHTTFRVKKRSYDSVTVDWEDGPTTRQVNALIGKHEYGSFDGMRDIYEHTNRRDDIPQCKYVHAHRELSQSSWIATLNWINDRFGYGMEYALIENPYGSAYCRVTNDSFIPGRGRLSDEIHRYGYKYPLICPDHKHAILLTDRFCPTCGCAIPLHDPNDNTYS